MFDTMRDREQEYREQVSQEVMSRLSEVELVVLAELLELREQHPDLNGAEFYRVIQESPLSKVYGAMERRWSRLVREVMRDEQATAN